MIKLDRSRLLYSCIVFCSFNIYANNFSIFLEHNGQSFEFIKIQKTIGPQMFSYPYVSFFRANVGGYQEKAKRKLAAEIYEKRNFKNVKPVKEYLIPPIIHQIWLGPHPLPKKYQRYQNQILKHNPGWLYKLWTNKDVERFSFENKFLLSKARSYAEQANILRYEILNIFGGVYLDTDVKSIKPLAPFHKCFDFYTGCEPFGQFVIGNAVIGSCPGHPVLEKINSHIRNNWKESKQKNIQLYRSGTRLWTQIVLEELAKYSRSTILPSNFFYPVSNHRRALKKETFLIHDFDVTWKSCIKTKHEKGS